MALDGSGTAWTAAGQIAVGLSGGGTLAISNDAAVEAAAAILVGANAGGSGMLTVNEGGTLASGGTLAILGDAAGASGTVTVNGAGSSWTVADELAVGASGAGTLIVSNGGVVRSNLAAQASVAALSIGSNGERARLDRPWDRSGQRYRLGPGSCDFPSCSEPRAMAR